MKSSCWSSRVERESIFLRATVQRGLLPSPDQRTPSSRLLLWLPTNLKRYDQSVHNQNVLILYFNSPFAPVVVPDIQLSLCTHVFLQVWVSRFEIKICLQTQSQCLYLDKTKPDSYTYIYTVHLQREPVSLNSMRWIFSYLSADVVFDVSPLASAV